MTTLPLTARPLSELAKSIETRELSPVDIVQDSLSRTSSFDGQLGAFISRYDDEALAQARRAEEDIRGGGYRGPLHGIPIGVKDNIFVRDRVTTMGSKIHSNFVPEFDAHVVGLLRDAGAILTGKLNLHEYALGVTTENPHFGTTRNPWDLSKTAGGSSGGSAAAVAGDLVVAALGSDTSGSIRIPASVCGIVGLKPTFGRVSKRGCFPEAWSLDHVGPITRTVADAAIMLDVLSGYDSLDPSSVDLPPTSAFASLTSDIRGMVIGIEEEFFFADVDDEIAAAVRSSIETLRDLGAVIKAVRLPSLKDCIYALTIIDSSETTTVHASALRERPEDFGDDVRLLLRCGTLPSAVDYLQAQQLRRRIALDFSRAFGEVDVIAAPTVGIKTPGVGERTSLVNGRVVENFDALVRLMGPANLAGLPALTVPCGLVDRMPVGLQLLAAPFEEQKVLNLGAAVEATKPLGAARPSALVSLS